MADVPAQPDPELVSAIVEAVDDYAIFMLDTSGMVVTWNAGVRRIKGYAADEIVGRDFSAFFTDDDVRAGKPLQLLKQAASDGRASDDGWRVRKDGSHFWASVVITALYDERGQVQGYVKVTRDETDRRAAEQTARELERFQDRDALGQDLSNAVINRIFTAGLIVEGLRNLSPDPLLHQQVDAVVEELDAAINELRYVLFGQHGDHKPPE
jgi:PAS domain S-box-containing protein